jgi:hypothetical protein
MGIKKKIGKVLATITLISALGIATVPRNAHASGLMPSGCDLALTFGFDKWGLLCFFQLALDDWCCDPTGDSWLD